MLSLWDVGDAISCYVCNSGEDYDRDRCADIPKDGKGYEDLIYNCSNLPIELGRSDIRNYTLCRKFIQDGKINVLNH